MINITDLQQEQKIMPILRLGFRPFFLLGSLFSLFAMLLWVLTLTGNVSIIPLNGVFWWHAHEMLFGFVPAIIAGFLLTAVQTWTGIPSVKGTKLLFLVIVWLLARFLLLLNLDIPLLLVMAIDVLFLPLTAFYLGKPIVHIKQYRNLIFVPVLLLMTIANILTYLPYLGFNPDLLKQGQHGMVLLATMLVAILGGRVVPMFTANGTKTTKVLPVNMLEIAAISSLFIIFLFLITGLTQYPMVLGGLCLFSAAIHTWRNLRWRPWVTTQIPLVWVLHGTMAFIPIGLGLLAIHYLLNSLSLSSALHALTVGVLGGMIIAMMSRVSLGHSGRKLNAKPIIVIGFYCIILSAITRSILVALIPELIMQWWLISGGLWCLAFVCFVWVYFPILTTARLDGRPG